MLFIQNLDKPGLIGAVGTLLGNANVNIADFNLGRIPGKNKAIALISVDTPVGAKIIDDIDALEQVERVTVLRF
jgi:D-3-phosphoglycerate dehydrogenase / 2-oxoglutarate reductase